METKKTRLTELRWSFHNRIIHPLVRAVAEGARWLHDATLPNEGEEEIEGEIIDLVPLFQRFKEERAQKKSHNLVIHTTVPSKWRFIDLEEGKIFHWDLNQKAYFENSEEGNWLRAYGPELLARIKLAMREGN